MLVSQRWDQLLMMSLVDFGLRLPRWLKNGDFVGENFIDSVDFLILRTFFKVVGIVITLIWD